MLTLFDYTVAAEDYETRLARGALKGDAFREAIEAVGRLRSIRNRRSPFTLASAPEWARTVITAVCDEHRVTVDQLLGDRRMRAIAYARHDAAWRLRGLGRSFPEIGAALGGRDHATIIYAVRAHEHRLAIAQRREERRVA